MSATTYGMLCGDCVRLKSLGIETYESDSPSLVLDEGKMSATGILATSTRDRQGDILEVRGIDTRNHKINPIVLLDHGLNYPLPVGRTQDDNGNYTVVIGEEEATQTTFFSQHSEVAEQVFRLLSDKTLTGNSIGFRPIETKPLPADLARGHRGGKHILRCELLEASWVALPANAECVQALLDTGKIGGKAMAPAIKTMLSPYIQQRKAWANGVDLMKKEYDEMSAVDETSGGALRKDDDMGDMDMNDDVADVEDSRDEPLGASVLRDFHADLIDVVNSYQEALPKLEQQKVKSKLEKLIADLSDSAQDVQELFAAVYPDAEPLDGAVAEAEGEDVDAEAEAVEDEGEDDVEEPDDAFEQKCYGKCADNVRQMLKDMVVDEEDGEKRMRLKQVLKQLDAPEEGEGEEMKEEEMSEEEMNSLKRLERAIVRREKIINRILS